MKVLLAAIVALLATPVIAEPLRLVTEDYPPYAFRENGILKGTSVEQIELMMKATGQAHTIEMMPWARALALAETQPMYCVFTTTHNAERDGRFKWVEPLLWGRTLLIRREGSGVEAADLKAASAYRVGATRDDFTVNLLKSAGFDKLDLASDFNLSLKKLLAGRIDLMPVTEDYYAKLRRDHVAVERVVVLSEQIFSLACNTSVPDAEIAKMQTALGKLIADGTQAALFRKYGLAIQSQ
jgi:polar amino acid transport system substrate-binding protein